jgi:hypothetical protein
MRAGGGEILCAGRNQWKSIIEICILGNVELFRSLFCLNRLGDEKYRFELYIRMYRVVRKFLETFLFRDMSYTNGCLLKGGKTSIIFPVIQPVTSNPRPRFVKNVPSPWHRVKLVQAVAAPAPAPAAVVRSVVDIFALDRPVQDRMVVIAMVLDLNLVLLKDDLGRLLLPSINRRLMGVRALRGP